ncbi:MAG: hypothetical protein NWT02_05465 [Opitutales bacterium]|nr:hypothetical protein [Opitutales bacterium]
MKTFLRLFLFFCILVLVLLVGGYFVVTNAGFQKKMIEGKLPEGSSVKYVHVTSSTLQLTELVLSMPDGTRIKVAEVDTTFSPLAALFDQTIQMGVLEVDGLIVNLPAQVAATSTGSAGTTSEPTKSEPRIKSETPASSDGNPWDAINSIGNLDWLLDIETIKLNGKLKDSTGSTYVFDVQSGLIRPGVETVLDASLSLVSSEAIQSGLKEFDSKTQLRFKQKSTGGFEEVHIDSQTVGKDANGSQLLSISNKLDLSFDGFEETADLQVQFIADIQRPEMFMPELAAMGALKVSGDAAARVEGERMTLTKAAMAVAANGSRLIDMQLKQALTLGGKQSLSGELLDLQLSSLPLAWLGPWMPEGMFVEGAPLSVQVKVTGMPDGAMEVRTAAPLTVGPVNVRYGEQLMLDQFTITMNPVIRVNADQSISYELNTLKMSDRYGEVISGEVQGRADPKAAVPGNPFAGQQVSADLNIGLQELFQLPVLKDKASILGGTLALKLAVDGKKEFPLEAQGSIRGLRPRSEPGWTKDYRFAAQVKTPQLNVWAIGANLEAGIAERPSTSLQFSGQANVASEPLAFKADLKGPQITQSDLDLLLAAFTPHESGQVTAPTPSAPIRPSVGGGTRQPAAQTTTAAPAWSAVKGEATIQFDRVILTSGQLITMVAAQALVSEPLLQVKGITAKFVDGTLNGSSEVRYASTQANAYTVLANLALKQIDPSIFSKKASGSFPIQGLFDGQFALSGAGATLEQALDNGVGDLTITGKDGILTAFELDNRSQMGLLGAGILGQAFDRPGISALAEAVPYFKDIHFSDFILELKRGGDKRIMIPQIKFTGDSILINGSGMVAASSYKEILNQPLQLGLEFGAKGRLTNYLETLQLLKPTTAEDGFRRWNQAVNLTGTLAKPNADQLMDLLNKAARSALSKPKSAPTPAAPTADPLIANPTQAVDPNATAEAPAQPVKKTKDEKRRDDIEMGLDLFNGVFGN